MSKEVDVTLTDSTTTINLKGTLSITGPSPPSPTPTPVPPTPGPTPSPTGNINKEGVKILATRDGKFSYELADDPNSDSQLKLESQGVSTSKTENGLKFHTVQGKVIHYASGQPDSKTVRFDMFPVGAKNSAQKHTWKDNPTFLWDSSVPLDFVVIGFYRPHKNTGTHTSTSIKIRGGVHTGSGDPRASDIEMDLASVGATPKGARELDHPNYDYFNLNKLVSSLGIEENVWYGLQLVSYVNQDGKSTTNQLYVIRDPFNADGSIKNDQWQLYSTYTDVDGHSTGKYTKAPLWSAFVTTLRIDGWDTVDFCKLAWYGIEKTVTPPIPTPTPTPVPTPTPTPIPNPVSDVPLPTPIQIQNTIAIPAGTTDFTSTILTKEKWGDNVCVKGAGKDQTILRYTGSRGTADTALISINSNIRFENLTVDANHLIDHATACGEPVKLEMVNCHFKSANQITNWNGGNLKTFVLQGCTFSDGSNGDQQACGINESALIENNVFDRSPASDPGGSCLTHGFGRNITIRNNTFKRSKEGFGISFEPWEKFGYEHIRVYNNTFENGDIIIGGPFTKLSFTFPFRDIIVTKNTIKNGYIHIDAPDLNSQWAKFHGITDIGLGYNQIKDIHLAGNTFQNPQGKQNIVISGEYNEDPLAPPTPTPTPTPQPPAPTPTPTPVKIIANFNVVNQSSSINDIDLEKYMKAVKKQCDNEGSVWGGSFVYQLSKDPSIRREQSLLLVTDISEGQGILGYHTEDGLGQPLIKIFASEIARFGLNVSTTISHEILETIADPTAGQTIKGRDPSGKPCLYYVEVGDPVENDEYQIDGIPVSDFARPSWFEINNNSPFDQMNKTTHSFEILQGGYVQISYDNGVHWVEIQARRTSITLNVEKDEHGNVIFGASKQRNLNTV